MKIWFKRTLLIIWEIYSKKHCKDKEKLREKITPKLKLQEFNALFENLNNNTCIDFEKKLSENVYKTYTFEI